jgi:elongation factor G
VLDTPGLPDFLGRALATLPAVETAVVVVNAAAGVETVTRKAMDAAAEKCRMIVVNRIDAPGVDFAALLERLRAAFGKECLPINLPTAGGERVIDCFFTPDYDAVPAFSSVREAHDQIVDQVVEVDEDLMALYLEQGESLQPEQLHDPFEQSLREGHLIPVCFTSARTGAGITELLDIMGRLLPDPTEGNPPQFLKGEGPAQAVSATTDADQHVIAHVFQVSNDPFRGKLGLFRIHQGTVTPNTQLFIGDARKPFKVGHLLRVQGKNQTEIDVGIPGDICAVARIDESTATRCSTTPTTKTTSTWPGRATRRPCSASRSCPKSTATSSASRKPSTASSTKTPASASSATCRPRRPSSAASARCTSSRCSTSSRAAGTSASAPARRPSPTARPSPARRVPLSP